jgi:hypothetical protein
VSNLAKRLDQIIRRLAVVLDNKQAHVLFSPSTKLKSSARSAKMGTASATGDAVASAKKGSGGNPPLPR